jgi:hypothetical protein
MIVVFDFEDEDYPLRRTLTPMVWEVLEEIRGYIKSRLMPLDEAMTAQEDYFGSYISFNILNEPRCNIIFNNYSPSLTKKMESCFSEENYMYLNMKLMNILSSFLN